MPVDPSSYYLLAVQHSGKFLTALENGNIVQNDIFDLDRQIWKFIPTEATNIYYLFLKGGEYCLQKGENDYLEIFRKTGGNNQKWEVKKIDHEYYLINNLQKIGNKNCYLDVEGARKTNNTTVIVYNGHGQDNEKWKLLPIPDTKISASASLPLPLSLPPLSSSIIHMKHLLESESFKNIIFQGPPGTSKTYKAKLLAASVVLGEDDDKKLEQIIQEEGNIEQSEFSKARFPGEGPKGAWSIVQFHPAYNYEDFVRGIEVKGIEVKGNGATVSYNAVRRIFDRMAYAAWKAYRKDAENCPKYVLIVDEINRAHLAAVLGELIYALEYRGSPVDSPYAVQDEGKESTKIIVPPNLYIIGTMNTADRSIGHIDYAVRRRFAFVPLLPEEEPINSDSGKELFREIKNLFKAENGGRAKTLSPEFHADDVQPGHTYFITRNSEVIDELASKFTYQVYPLLREYFKDGVLINVPKLFDGKLALDTPIPPKEVLEIVKSFLGRP